MIGLTPQCAGEYQAVVARHGGALTGHLWTVATYCAPTCSLILKYLCYAINQVNLGPKFQRTVTFNVTLLA